MGLTYLITGAARGIGLGLTTTLLARPSTTVIAAVRDTISATNTLSSIPVGSGSKLIVVKIDAESDTDALSAASELASKYSVNTVDVVIANAGLLSIIKPVLETPAEVVRQHFQVNSVAPMVLLQAFMPMLEKSAAPKFLVITSSIGSLTNMENVPIPFYAYGVSKAAANYLVRKVAFENPKLVSAAFNPGWVQTEMGNGAAKGVGMEGAPMTTEDSVKGLIKLFDEVSLEKTATFTGVDGNALAW